MPNLDEFHFYIFELSFFIVHIDLSVCVPSKSGNVSVSFCWVTNNLKTSYNRHLFFTHRWSSATPGWAQLDESANLLINMGFLFLLSFFFSFSSSFVFFKNKSSKIYSCIIWHSLVVDQCLEFFERQYNINVKSFRARLRRFKSQLSHFLAVCSWGSHLFL